MLPFMLCTLAVHQASGTATFPAPALKAAQAEQRNRLVSSREARLRAGIAFEKSASSQLPVVSQARWESLIGSHLSEPSRETHSEILMLLQPRELAASIADEVGASALARLEDFTIYSTKPSGTEKRLSIQLMAWRRHQESVRNFLSAVRDAETRSALLSSIGGLDEMVWAGTRDIAEVRAFVTPEWDRVSIRLDLIDALGEVIPSRNLSFSTIPEPPLPLVALGGLGLPKTFEELERVDYTYWRVSYGPASEPRKPWNPESELRKELEKYLRVNIHPLSDHLGAILVRALYARKLEPTELREWLILHGFAAEVTASNGDVWLLDTLAPNLNRSSSDWIVEAQESSDPDPFNFAVMQSHAAAGFPGVPPTWLNAFVAQGHGTLGRSNLPSIPLRALIGSLTKSEWKGMFSDEGCTLDKLTPKQQSWVVQTFENYPFLEISGSAAIPLAKQAHKMGKVTIRASLGEQFFVRSEKEELGWLEGVGSYLAKQDRDPSNMPFDMARSVLPRYELMLGNGRRWSWTAAVDLGEKRQWSPIDSQSRALIREGFQQEKERMMRRRELHRQIIRP